jgi:N-carbamoylputrescine amidase
MIGKYRKMHIPDDPQYYEKFYFTPGDLGFKTFKTNYGKIGTLVCWDQWFPEAARLTTLLGAEVIFYPTAIGWHPKEKAKYGKSQLEAWTSVQRSHAIANGVYVAAVNRIGIEKQGTKKLDFWGHSVLFDPSGNIIARAGTKEQTLICDIDLKKIDTVRQHWPFLRDRRIDYYKGILKNPKDD